MHVRAAGGIPHLVKPFRAFLLSDRQGRTETGDHARRGHGCQKDATCKMLQTLIQSYIVPHYKNDYHRLTTICNVCDTKKKSFRT